MDLQMKNLIRDKLGFRRKPEEWDEVGYAIPVDILDQLQIFSAAELGIEHNIGNDFNFIPEEIFFLVVKDGGLYLVNTEGADYARYIRYVGDARFYIKHRNETKSKTPA